MPMKRIATSICVVAFLCGVLFGQSTTGSLTGTIVDSSGAAVPGAQVQAKDLRTGAVRDSVSGPEGIFAFNSLEPDRYNLTVKASGFKAYTQSDIDITANAPRDLGKTRPGFGRADRGDLGHRRRNASANGVERELHPGAKAMRWTSP